MNTQSCEQFSGLRSPRLSHEDSSWVFPVLRGKLGQFLELNTLETAALNVHRLAVDPSQVFSSTQNTETKAVMPLSQESTAMLGMGDVHAQQGDWWESATDLCLYLWQCPPAAWCSTKALTPPTATASCCHPLTTSLRPSSPHRWHLPPSNHHQQPLSDCHNQPARGNSSRVCHHSLTQTCSAASRRENVSGSRQKTWKDYAGIAKNPLPLP